MLMWIGYGLIAVAAGWFLHRLWSSFSSALDYDFNPYAAAIIPPVLGVVGLFLVLRSYDFNWPLWLYLIIWAALTAAVSAAVWAADRFGL